MDPAALADLRLSYSDRGLAEDDLAADPYDQLDRWLTEAVAAGLTEPNAMVLGTVGVGADGSAAVPSARTVLLKGAGPDGLVFFTSYTSRKGTELAGNPAVSLVFPWYDLQRQVVVIGRTHRVDRAETEAYFHSRPRASQLGAWASRQSSVLPAGEGRAALDARYAALALRWPDGTQVPVPDFWGGVRVVPETMEFWQGRPSRLHDRLRYVRGSAGSAGWRLERLSP